ncbi:MAG: ATPase, T2SS/T4P/T4SS family [Myxococcales bacterium]|nr:ATPase, T2SS/T4P/T4SS family [Myxococcales bacterium]
MIAVVAKISDSRGRVSERELQARTLWIGRESSCDLVLDCELVSRRHARIELTEGRWELFDSSSNGTRIAGHRVVGASLPLSPGQPIEIGSYSLRLNPEPRRASKPRRGDNIEVPAELRRRLHRELIEHLDLSRLDPAAFDAQALRPRVELALGTICSAHASELPKSLDLDALITDLCDEALGLGPLEAALADPEVSEIMVVDPQTIYLERAGKLSLSPLRFTDAEAARTAIERIITPLGRRIDESSPLVDARLPDGSRVNAIIPPLASRGPCITIRKFPETPLTLSDLVRRGSLDADTAELLQSAVAGRRNIVISGGTGSGKTTLLNVLSGAIPEDERIVTIEDAAELRLAQRHVVGLESRPANMEGRGAFTIGDLVRNALRMRPDRIIVGECRGGEAIDMLQAMNTGHEGSMTTTHANSPAEAVQRLETLCLMAGLDLPTRAIRQQIASSVHVIVQQTRCADGSRRISCVSEVVGLDDAHRVLLQDIVRYEPAADSGRGAFRPTGYLPTFSGTGALSEPGVHP